MLFGPGGVAYDFNTIVYPRKGASCKEFSSLLTVEGKLYTTLCRVTGTLIENTFLFWIQDSEEMIVFR